MAESGPVTTSSSEFRHTSSFTHRRWSKLTSVGVLADHEKNDPFLLVHLVVAASISVSYVTVGVPRLREFGSERWSLAVAAGSLEPQSCGPFAEPSLVCSFALSFMYVMFTWLGARHMARRAPVRGFVFECLLVHNCTQCVLNVYCLLVLGCEAHTRGLRLWGNVETQSHGLGSVMWLQYHCRQLQLLDTAFMVVRKKFHGISIGHVYLRVLNLWGWFIACRFACGAESHVPALISAACQALVYGIYFTVALGSSASAAATSVARVQVVQYVACAFHSVLASMFGNFSPLLAVLHLFAISNGLVLYTNFHSEDDRAELRTKTAPAREPRVTFSFDSCGWLMVHHFGVGAWLYDHMSLARDPTSETNDHPSGVAFSGSSGGALICSVLAAGSSPWDVFKFILTKYDSCRRNPTMMFTAVRDALDEFEYPGAHKRLSGNVRLLLTRVLPRPPFITGHVADVFPDNKSAIDHLCASCHIPVLDGVCPRRIGDRFFYDGLMWPSRFLVPWRGAEGDIVVRVSASGSPGSDVCLPSLPHWWGVFPPPPDILTGIFWCGYRDAAQWFAKEPPTREALCGSRDRRSAERDESHRWRAARKLLTRDPAAAPVAVCGDPDKMEELIQRTLALASRDFARLRRAFVVFGIA